MTDEFRPSPDNQPILEGEQPPEFVPGGEPAVYEFTAQPEAETATSSPPLLGWLRAIFGRQERVDIRVAELSQMIESYPESPANYVFRGELLLETGAYEQAADDFQKALNIASEQTASADWGLVAQAVQDRAYAGLEKIQGLRKRKRTSDLGISG